MDNASIHHVDKVTDLIETHDNARLCFLPPYSPDLMPVEEVFSKVKTIIKDDTCLYQMIPRLVIAMAFTIARRLPWLHFILWLPLKVLKHMII